MSYYGGLEIMNLTKELDIIANLYHETKNKKYKDLWYEKVKEMSNGIDNTKRRVVSVSAVNKADDGTYVVIGKSKLLWPMRNNKSKANNIR